MDKFKMMDVKGGSQLQNGFRVLVVKFDETYSAERNIFYKEHKVHHETEEDAADKPEGRTLFVINIPPYCNEESIGGLFRKHGVVEKVFFPRQQVEGGPCWQTEEQRGYKYGYVVFAKKAHLKKVLAAEFSETLLLSTPKNTLEPGLKQFMREYNESVQPDVEDMKRKINAYMQEYDRKTKAEEEEAMETEGVPDEEGWIKVTKYSKKNVNPRTVTKEEKIKEKEASKKPRKELKDFYTFQIRESKMEHIAELRQKFEDDKRRIALMKETRKFNPFKN